MMLMRKTRNHNLRMVLWVLFASLWCWTSALKVSLSGNESDFVFCMKRINMIINGPNYYFMFNHTDRLIPYIYVTDTYEHQKPICKDIISDGSIDYYFEQRVYNYVLHKEEVSGFECSVDPKYIYKSRECHRNYFITTNSDTLNCSRWKNPLAKLKHDLPQFTIQMYQKHLALLTTHIISLNTGYHFFSIDCYLHVIGKDRRRGYFYAYEPFVTILTKENSYLNKNCTDFIVDDTLHFNKNNTVDYVMLRNIDGYDCKVNNDEILEMNKDTLKIRSSTYHLFCQEKDVENKRGSAVDGFIRCPFEMLWKGGRYYLGHKQTQDYFIFINSTESIPCWKIVPRRIENYHNTYLRFYLFKKEISGFECDVDEADLVKRHSDSNEYLTERKGLICHKWIGESKPIPTGAYEKKIIQCPFEKLIKDDPECFKATMEKRNFIHVTSDDYLHCNSFILNGEIMNRDVGSSIYFYLYKKEYSGYECHVPNAFFQNNTAIIYKVMASNDVKLNCTKVKDDIFEDKSTVKKETFFLDCYYQDTIMINGTPSTSSYFYSAPTIYVTSPTKENCNKIIQGFIKKTPETNLVSLVLYKEEVYGYNCSLEHNEKIEDLGTMYYIERKANLPLECKKIETLDPENVTILGTDDENIDEETNKVKGEQKQVGQNESESVDEGSDIQLNSEELIDEKQTTPEPVTMKNATEVTRNTSREILENFSRNPEEETVTKSGKKMKPDQQQITHEPPPKKKTPEVSRNSDIFARNYEEGQLDANVGENVEPAKRRNWKSALN